MQTDRVREAIKKAFTQAGITPFQSGAWERYVESAPMTKGSPQVSNILHQVCLLQEKQAISSCRYKCGLDDQDPKGWDDVDTQSAEGLVVPKVDGLSSDEDEREGETGDEMQQKEEWGEEGDDQEAGEREEGGGAGGTGSRNW
jgi:hypothetical protein